MRNGRLSWLPVLILSVAVTGCASVPGVPPAASAPPTGSLLAPEPGATELDADPELDPNFDRVEGDLAAGPGTEQPDGSPGPAGEGPGGQGWEPGQEPEVPAGFTVTGTPADRVFIDEMVPLLLFGLAVLDRSAKHGTHSELKALAARLKPDWQAKVKQLRAYRLAWFGSARVPSGGPIDLSYLEVGPDFDWMAADEIMRLLQSGLDSVATADQGTPREETRAVMDALTQAWTPERNQLNAWVTQWLAEAPLPQEPAE